MRTTVVVALLLLCCSVLISASLIYQKDGDSCVPMDLHSCRQCLIDYNNGTTTDDYYHCESEEGMVSTSCWADDNCVGDSGLEYYYHIPTKYCNAMSQCEIAMSTVVIFDVIAQDGLVVRVLDGFDSVMNQTSTSVTVYGEVGKLGFTNTGMKHPLRILRMNEDTSYLTSHGECILNQWCTLGALQIRMTAHVLDNDKETLVGAYASHQDLVDFTGAFRTQYGEADLAEEVVGLEGGQFMMWHTAEPTVLLSLRERLVLPVSKLSGFQYQLPIFDPVSELPDYGVFIDYSDIEYSHGQINATRTVTGKEPQIIQGDCSTSSSVPYEICTFSRFD